MLPASKERSRFRSITWDQYDPVHQKYLEIGGFCFVNFQQHFLRIVLNYFTKKFGNLIRLEN